MSYRLPSAGYRQATRRRSPRAPSRRPPGCGRRSSRSPIPCPARAMDKVALLDNAERSALFDETGAARGVAIRIIEKDFRVCWTLKCRFESQDKDAPALLFKGGTS